HPPFDRFSYRGRPDVLESQLVSAFRAAASLPDTETLDLRQPSLSPLDDAHQQQQHYHHHHHHQQQQQQHHHPHPLSLSDYSRKRSHRHLAELPNFFASPSHAPTGAGELGAPGAAPEPQHGARKKPKFSNAAAAAAAAVAANYYDNAYLSFEKSLRGAFGGSGDPMGVSALLDGHPAAGTLDPYGHHLLSPINYTLTAEAINRRIRSTLGLDDPTELGVPRERGTSTSAKATPEAGGGECCTTAPSPDWMRRGSSVAGPTGLVLGDPGGYGHSPVGPGTPPITAYEEHKFAAHFSPVPPAGTLHDDNNNVDKKPTFQE
ncbi:atrophin-1-like, partial [Anopheles cruzii]|uniref:atrophin-1-like n=1 Tax=Anopheles cruzii TaxID=68878 RepID=UPI0022EC8979